MTEGSAAGPVSHRSCLSRAVGMGGLGAAQNADHGKEAKGGMWGRVTGEREGEGGEAREVAGNQSCHSYGNPERKREKSRASWTRVWVCL